MNPFLPFRFGAGPATRAPFFGGTLMLGDDLYPNHLISVPALEEGSQWLCVLLDATFDFVLDHGNRPMQTGLSWRVSLAEPRPSEGNALLPGHNLLLGVGVTDDQERSTGEPYWSHKIGGVASARNPDAADAIALLRRQGFVHALQLDFPANPDDEPVDCDWPFGEGVLNFFSTKDRSEAAWVWQL